MGMSGVEISRRLGRSDSWFTNLRGAKTNRSAAVALAEMLGMSERDVIADESKPKPEQEPQIAFPNVSALVPSNLVKLKDEEITKAIRENTETLKKISDMLAVFSVDLVDELRVLTTSIDALREPIEPNSKREDVEVAKGVLDAMTQATGECDSKKFHEACESRGIINIDRLQALAELNAMYQWRTNANGKRKCYIVRGY
jgi:hypothetical protein